MFVLFYFIRTECYNFSIPQHHTTATSKDGEKSIVAGKEVTIIDTVKLDGLKKGTKYQLKGWQMIKDENAELIINGKRVENSYTFTADDKDMKIEMEYMFKKKEKQKKEKKVRTVKVGTHRKSVIALWVVLIASVSFGVYKNFTAIDRHTVHEKETIQLRLNDTNGIENFVKNFCKSYYTWSNSKEAIEARTQAINGYLTKELQDLNIDTVRTDIPTNSTVTDVIIWDVEQAEKDDLSQKHRQVSARFILIVIQSMN